MTVRASDSLNLSAQKRALLDALLKEDGLTRPASPTIPRRKADGACPLSFAQQRLWFLDQFAPGNPFYNVNSVIRLPFPMNIEALEQSFNEVVRRHEVLRTRFEAIGGKPAQVIESALRLPLLVHDLRLLSAADAESESRRIVTADARHPFDLARGPLVRISLIRLADNDAVLSLNMHHIVSDGWSMDVFAKEIGALYVAFCAGNPSPLPELPIQYADFAVWQRELLQGDLFQEQLTYWKKQLENLPALQLPTDRPRPAAMSYRGARSPIVVPPALSAKLKALGHREGATLFMVLLGAFQALLHRFSW